MIDDILSLDKSKAISGALKSQIDAHGPITKEWVGSATKRIIGAVNACIKQKIDIKQPVESGTQLPLFPEKHENI